MKKTEDVATLVKKAQEAKTKYEQEVNAELTAWLESKNVKLIPVVQIGETYLPISQVLAFPAGWAVVSN